ncbi:hypothetical protein [Burkholderia pseudomallei]|uniref:hypothetical protein n=1 Tax=Burkholderia pseudomallei TaxID=28450 RepID=UPI000F57768A|nr:hypothetical protein [Burkholderia pseudomallei]MBM5578638.1 hypothetical protein [Burkholderia pseudomallei]MBM5583729.1 hypothetical protein [Burkholderia pseudomallei]RPA00674.1 hypothetical protein EGT86_28875 [Burkholderia pseudomallei]
MDEAEWNARFSVHVFRGSIRSAAFAGTMPDGFAREPSSRAAGPDRAVSYCFVRFFGPPCAMQTVKNRESGPAAARSASNAKYVRAA